MNGRLILSLVLPQSLPAAADPLVQQLLGMLRERQVRATCLVSTAWLAEVRQRQGQALVDSLAWHDRGLCYEPPPLPAEAPRRGDAWWQLALDHHLDALGEQVSSCERDLGCKPSALVVAPAAFAPPVSLAASRLHIPLLLDAPCDDRPAGSLLHMIGSAWLTRHQPLAPALDTSCRLATWQHDLRAAMQALSGPRPVHAIGANTAHLLAPVLAAGARSQTAWRKRAESVAEHLGTHFASQLSVARALVPPPDAPTLTADELRELAALTTHCLCPLAIGDRVYSLAELFSAFLQAGAARGATGELPQRVRPLPLLGPCAPTPPLDDVLMHRDDLLRACAPLAESCRESLHLPGVVRLGDTLVTPSSLLYALARVVRRPQETLVKLPAGPLPQLHATRKSIRQAADQLADIQGAPHGPHTRKALLAQCWTARPA